MLSAWILREAELTEMFPEIVLKDRLHYLHLLQLQLEIVSGKSLAESKSIHEYRRASRLNFH